MIKRKIAILTQPLHANYGGLLQAYALQKVLLAMGHDVVTDRHPKQKFKPYYRQLLYPFKYTFLKYIWRRKGIETVFPCSHTKETYPIVSVNTQKFVDEQIRTVDFFQGNDRPSEAMINSFDTFIIGSDQVWRPKYSSFLPAYFLDFTEGKSCKRISYAASFGVSNWELNEKQTLLCKHLLQQFDAVSVREDAAISLCKTHLETDAVHVLDPTLLLDKTDYVDLVEQAKEPVCSGNLMVYVLNRTEEKTLIMNEVARVRGLKPFEIMPKRTLVNSTKKQLHLCSYPTVTRWIRGFMDAEYVVTDSFHGSVFAIIFNKPFIAIGHKRRGLARFNSLLSLFSLEDRLIHSLSELTTERIQAPIDFERINALRKSEIIKSVDFLKHALK